MIKRRFIDDKLRATAIIFGYQEVATPTFENAELFVGKSGSEILDQIYLFRDKGDRELVLRPELTAPVIRFYANDLYKKPKPLKVFYAGNCFRYERPQKGRFREFWQFGAELIGTNRPEGIAELIAFSTTCLTNLNLRNFELRVGYLEILKRILTDWEIPAALQARLMVNIDKGDIEALRDMLEDAGLSLDNIDNFSRLVEYNFSASEFDAHSQLLSKQFPNITELLDRFSLVIKYLKIFILDEFTIDLGIARGLDYYTGVVFEIDVPNLGAEKQVCGGGEYSLEGLFDLKDVSCSGFAIGFDRVVVAYDAEKLQVSSQDLDIFIIPLTQPGLVKAIEVSKELRSAGFKLDLDIKGRNMSKNLKFASSRNTKFVLFIGDDELKKDSVLIREMVKGDQKMVKFVDLLDFLNHI